MSNDINDSDGNSEHEEGQHVLPHKRKWENYENTMKSILSSTSLN